MGVDVINAVCHLVLHLCNGKYLFIHAICITSRHLHLLVQSSYACLYIYLLSFSMFVLLFPCTLSPLTIMTLALDLARNARDSAQAVSVLLQAEGGHQTDAIAA